MKGWEGVGRGRKGYSAVVTLLMVFLKGVSGTIYVLSVETQLSSFPSFCISSLMNLILYNVMFLSVE